MPAESTIPTKPGYYWALWITTAEGTADDSLSGKWEIVEVWENFPGEPCEADDEHAPKWGVSVHGVEKSQWLENFKWGSEVASRFVVEQRDDLLAAFKSLVEMAGELSPLDCIGWFREVESARAAITKAEGA